MDRNDDDLLLESFEWAIPANLNELSTRRLCLLQFHPLGTDEVRERAELIYWRRRNRAQAAARLARTSVAAIGETEQGQTPAIGGTQPSEVRAIDAEGDTIMSGREGTAETPSARATAETPSARTGAANRPHTAGIAPQPQITGQAATAGDSNRTEVNTAKTSDTASASGQTTQGGVAADAAPAAATSAAHRPGPSTSSTPASSRPAGAQSVSSAAPGEATQKKKTNSSTGNDQRFRWDPMQGLEATGTFSHEIRQELADLRAAASASQSATSVQQSAAQAERQEQIRRDAVIARRLAAGELAQADADHAWRDQAKAANLRKGASSNDDDSTSASSSSSTEFIKRDRPAVGIRHTDTNPSQRSAPQPPQAGSGESRNASQWPANPAPGESIYERALVNARNYIEAQVRMNNSVQRGHMTPREAAQQAARQTGFPLELFRNPHHVSVEEARANLLAIPVPGPLRNPAVLQARFNQLRRMLGDPRHPALFLRTLDLMHYLGRGSHPYLPDFEFWRRRTVLALGVSRRAQAERRRQRFQAGLDALADQRLAEADAEADLASIAGDLQNPAFGRVQGGPPPPPYQAPPSYTSVAGDAPRPSEALGGMPANRQQIAAAHPMRSRAPSASTVAADENAHHAAEYHGQSEHVRFRDRLSVVPPARENDEAGPSSPVRTEGSAESRDKGKARAKEEVMEETREEDEEEAPAQQEDGRGDNSPGIFSGLKRKREEDAEGGSYGAEVEAPGDPSPPGTPGNKRKKEEKDNEDEVAPTADPSGTVTAVQDMDEDEEDVKPTVKLENVGSETPASGATPRRIADSSARASPASSSVGPSEDVKPKVPADLVANLVCLYVGNIPAGVTAEELRNWLFFSVPDLPLPVAICPAARSLGATSYYVRAYYQSEEEARKVLNALKKKPIGPLPGTRLSVAVVRQRMDRCVILWSDVEAWAVEKWDNERRKNAGPLTIGGSNAGDGGPATTGIAAASPGTSSRTTMDPLGSTRSTSTVPTTQGTQNQSLIARLGGDSGNQAARPSKPSGQTSIPTAPAAMLNQEAPHASPRAMASAHPASTAVQSGHGGNTAQGSTPQSGSTDLFARLRSEAASITALQGIPQGQPASRGSPLLQRLAGNGTGQAVAATEGRTPLTERRARALKDGETQPDLMSRLG